jgi:allophanate hydrolase
VETTNAYRLYALPGSQPPKPGLLRAADGAGAAVKLDLWTLDPAGFCAFVATIPALLGVGAIRLSDGSASKAFGRDGGGRGGGGYLESR